MARPNISLWKDYYSDIVKSQFWFYNKGLDQTKTKVKMFVYDFGYVCGLVFKSTLGRLNFCKQSLKYSCDKIWNGWKIVNVIYNINVYIYVTVWDVSEKNAQLFATPHNF